jgi:hypothetical protein
MRATQIAAFLAARDQHRGARTLGGRTRLTRETDFGHDVYEADLPLVISVAATGKHFAPDGGDEITVWQATICLTTSGRTTALRPDRFPDPVLAVHARPERAAFRAGARRRGPRARPARRTRSRGAGGPEAWPRSPSELPLLERLGSRATANRAHRVDRAQPQPRGWAAELSRSSATSSTARCGGPRAMGPKSCAQ